MTDASEGLDASPSPVARGPTGAHYRRGRAGGPCPVRRRRRLARDARHRRRCRAAPVRHAGPPRRRGACRADHPDAQARDTEQRRLIVGREISLTGEITSCDRLIVEGSVEANLNNCREIEIAETGLLKGTAAIEDAEIRGRFEGSLTVRKRLLIRATGKVTGTVRYGQLEIECGGQISGDVQAQPTTEEAEQRPPRTVVPMPAEMKL